jgi:hypothetical protein
VLLTSLSPHPRSPPSPLILLPMSSLGLVTGVVAKPVAEKSSATPVIAVPATNDVSSVDVHAKVEVDQVSGTPTPPPRIGVHSARNTTVGVGVGADVVGSRFAATPTPPVFPPPPAVAVGKVDVAAKTAPIEPSETSTLPALGFLHLAVGVAAEAGARRESATSTPMRLLSSIVSATMGATFDEGVMQ